MDRAIGAGQGALSGVGAGAAAGGVPGAVIGGVAGLALGYLGSDDSGYELPWDQYNARLGQIANYSSQLESANAQYASAVNNMYHTAYDQYLPDAAAKFAAHGQGIDSGAFAAEAARTATQFTAEGLKDSAMMNINRINSVNHEYGNAWASMFGATNRSNEVGYESANANMAGLGSAAVGIGKLGLYNRMNNDGPVIGHNFYTNGSTNATNYGLGHSWNGGNPFMENA